ncbi:hypothetical protein O9G_000371 [Rozella allomycis CSF55]|uniref:RNase III domain-containing protein n=1 Tax=Rozella allomycis (strain CSF55) TaxID=988480 RepID=A0A075ATL0_ROZAC|nr:hypothetical protein O9G_000371 [Rozella allomycis CSF55]|eukprot:EPZ33596.1 hypothetical protein O9G_000371 [Rozella allomycis CSF55]
MEGKKENTFTYREFFQRKFGEQALIELEVGAKNKRNKLMIPQECVKYVDERLIHLRSVDFESIHQVLVKVHSEIFFNWKSISITNCFKFLSTDHARLRYIGDALLDCYVLKKLINLHPNADKNFIENQRMKIVNNVNLERCYSDLKLSVMFDLVNGDIRQFIYQSFAFKTSKYSKEIYKAFRPKQVCSPSKKVSSDIVEALLAYFFIHENDEQCLRLLSNITRLKEESFIASETSVLTHSANFEYLGKYAYLDFGSCLKRNEEQTRIYFGKLFSKNDLIKVFREMQNMVQK